MIDFAQIARRLQLALEDSGLTPEELGKKASVDASLLRELIAGRPTKVSTGALARIAREMGVEPTGLWASPPHDDDDARLAVPASDPLAPPGSERRFLERRVLEAVARGLITRMRARELLSLGVWDYLPEG